MGFTTDAGGLGERILTRMHECASDLDRCHYPPGSDFGNQKRDQSALNAALCGSSDVVCDTDDIYWAYASQYGLLVEEDETRFNDVVFYSRRGVPPQNYIGHIKPFPPQTVDTGLNVDTHLGT
jgi:hypothetical protein